MRVALYFVLVVVLSSGCVAVPALKERGEVRSGALWIEEHCPGVRGPDGARVNVDGRSVPLAQADPDSLLCNGRKISYEAASAMAENKIPRDPNALECAVTGRFSFVQRRGLWPVRVVVQRLDRRQRGEQPSLASAVLIDEDGVLVDGGVRDRD